MDCHVFGKNLVRSNILKFFSCVKLQKGRMDWTMSPEAPYSDEGKMDRIYI